MKLKMLEWIPRGANGWMSPQLKLGDSVTALFAANGSGKTPIIQSLAFCLGYPVIFREDINSKVEAVELTIEVAGHELVIRRSLSREFELRVVQRNGTYREYLSEADFSTAIFQTLGWGEPALVASDKQQTRPYMSTVLPIYYLDQDLGYGDTYKAPRHFILDQFVEMVRFVFGLSPKHSYHSKRDLLKAKDELDVLDRKIVQQQKIVSDISSRTDDSFETKLSLDNRASEVAKQLSNLRETVTSKGGANAALEGIRQEKEAGILETRRQVKELTHRINGISSIRSEIETEIATLALNEESRRVFSSFEDICRNPDCGLFIGSSQSYAKNLVYLKDQIKDLERNVDRASVRLEELSLLLLSQEREHQNLVEKISENSATEGIQNLVVAIQQYTREVFTIEQHRSSIALLSTERNKLLKLEADRSRVQDQIANLTVVGRADLEFNKLRSRVQSLTVRWLDILETQNVARSVEIDLSFQFRFGNEAFAVLKGSTKARASLAVHAALFEYYLENPKNPLRFLILDTPKQHEMHTGDIAQYLVELGNVCARLNGQLIFSSTEYHHPIGLGDVEWTPTFTDFKKPMYLGPVPSVKTESS